jgi:hypothetical protein
MASRLRSRILGITFSPSEMWHLVWDLRIWAYLLGPRNLDTSFETLDFVYLIWGSRKPTEGGRRSKRAERSVKAMALARSLWLQCSNPWVSLSSLSIITFLTSFVKRWYAKISILLKISGGKTKKLFFHNRSWKRFDCLLSSSVLNASRCESIIKSWIPENF